VEKGVGHVSAVPETLRNDAPLSDSIFDSSLAIIDDDDVYECDASHDLERTECEEEERGVGWRRGGGGMEGEEDGAGDAERDAVATGTLAATAVAAAAVDAAAARWAAMKPVLRNTQSMVS